MSSNTINIQWQPSLARLAVVVRGWHRQRSLGSTNTALSPPHSRAHPPVLLQHTWPWHCPAPELLQDIQPSHISSEERGRAKLCHTMFVCAESCFPCPPKWPLAWGLSENGLHKQ